MHGPAPRVHQETDHEVGLGRRVRVAVAAEAAAGVRGVVVAAAAVRPRLRRGPVILQDDHGGLSQTLDSGPM